MILVAYCQRFSEATQAVIVFAALYVLVLPCSLEQSFWAGSIQVLHLRNSDLNVCSLLVVAATAQRT